MLHRLDRIAARFERLLLAEPADVFWLAGFQARTSPAYLWLDADGWTLVAPEEDIDRAPGGIALRPYVGYDVRNPEGAAVRAADALAAVARRRSYAAGADPPLSLAHRLGEPTEVVAADLARVRAVKDADELELIRDNVRILDRALIAAATVVEPGRREAEVYAALLASLVDAVGADVVPAGNLGSGERSLVADPHASQRVLATGDPVLVDAYPSLRGYGADLARTWVCGKPTGKLVAAHEAVAGTLEEIGARLRPGLMGCEVDGLARKVLTEAVGGAEYRHHTGHGFGVRQWEPPWLAPGSSDVLEAGMVVAVEPGLYEVGVGGVRLEQDYIITADGAEPLSLAPFSWDPCVLRQDF